MRAIPFLNLFVGLLGVGAIPTAQAVTLSFEPDVQIVQPGDFFEIAVRISDLGDGTGPSVGAFDLDIAFDPSVIDVPFLPSGVVFGDPLLGDQLDLFGLGSDTDASYILQGISIYELSFDGIAVLNALQAPDFILATLQFEALAPGTSALEFIVDELSDAFGDPLSVQLETGSIRVGAAPEPGSWLLVSLGLVGLRRYAKR